MSVFSRPIRSNRAIRTVDFYIDLVVRKLGMRAMAHALRNMDRMHVLSYGVTIATLGITAGFPGINESFIMYSLLPVIIYIGILAIEVIVIIVPQGFETLRISWSLSELQLTLSRCKLQALQVQLKDLMALKDAELAQSKFHKHILNNRIEFLQDRLEDVESKAGQDCTAIKQWVMAQAAHEISTVQAMHKVEMERKDQELLEFKAEFEQMYNRALHLEAIVAQMNEKSDLDRAISANEISKLRDQRDQLETQLTQVKIEFDEQAKKADQELLDSNAELEQAYKRSVHLEAIVAQLNEKSDLDRATSANEISKLRDQRDQLEIQLTQVRIEFDEHANKAEEELLASTAIVFQLRAERADLETQVVDAVILNDQLGLNLVEVEQQRHQAMEYSNTLFQILRDGDSKLNSLCQEKDTLEKQLSYMKETNEELEVLFEEVVLDLQDDLTQATRKSTELESLLEKECEEHRLEIENLTLEKNAELTQAKQHLQEMMALMAVENQRAVDVLSVEMQEELTQLSDELLVVLEDKCSLESLVFTKDRELATCKSEMIHMQAMHAEDLERVQQSLRDAHAESLLCVSAQKSALESQVATLNNCLHSLKSMMMEAEHQHVLALQQVKVEMLEVNSHLTMENASLRHRLSKLEESLVVLNSSDSASVHTLDGPDLDLMSCSTDPMSDDQSVDDNVVIPSVPAGVQYIDESSESSILLLPNEIDQHRLADSAETGSQISEIVLEHAVPSQHRRVRSSNNKKRSPHSKRKNIRKLARRLRGY